MNTLVPVIRPRQIFKLVEDRFPDSNVEITLTMPPSGIGGLLTLEMSLMLALLKVTDARRIFEFGTYLGNTALLFANNSPPDAVITSLDLPPECIEVVDESRLNLTDGEQNDQFLRQQHKVRGAPYLSRAPRSIQDKVTIIQEDSRKFTPSLHGLQSSQDIIFVDGGHDLETIANDTDKAFLMAKQDSIIVWHDYMSQTHTDVTTYLSRLAQDRPLLAIGSTMLCVCLQGSFKNLLKIEN